MTLVMNQVARVVHGLYAPFDINSLFANGELGALYDHSDLTTLNQVSIGTIPVTNDANPVGLRFDKSNGLVLGTEKIVNGSFDSDTDWTKNAGVTISGGELIFTSVASANGASINAGVVVPGNLYKVTLTVNSLSAGGFRVKVGNGSYANLPAGAGVKTVYCVAGVTTTKTIGIDAAGTTTGAIDNVSVKEISGHHSLQSTATARPLYKTGPSRLDFDGIDDLLTTTFPDLGSDVTIARSIPGAGASILTGQTIGAGAWSDSTDSCAVVIVNRALTPTETTGLTAWLNEKAGV